MKRATPEEIFAGLIWPAINTACKAEYSLITVKPASIPNSYGRPGVRMFLEYFEQHYEGSLRKNGVYKMKDPRDYLDDMASKFSALMSPDAPTTFPSLDMLARMRARKLSLDNKRKARKTALNTMRKVFNEVKTPQAIAASVIAPEVVKKYIPEFSGWMNITTKA